MRRKLILSDSSLRTPWFPLLPALGAWLFCFRFFFPIFCKKAHRMSYALFQNIFLSFPVSRLKLKFFLTFCTRVSSSENSHANTHTHTCTCSRDTQISSSSSVSAKENRCALSLSLSLSFLFLQFFSICSFARRRHGEYIWIAKKTFLFSTVSTWYVCRRRRLNFVKRRTSRARASLLVSLLLFRKRTLFFIISRDLIWSSIRSSIDRRLYSIIIIIIIIINWERDEKGQAVVSSAFEIWTERVVVVVEVPKKDTKAAENEPSRFYFKILVLLRRRNEDGLMIHTSIIIIVITKRRRRREKKAWLTKSFAFFVYDVFFTRQTDSHQTDKNRGRLL